MDTFDPRLEILPPAQARIWPLLAPAAELGFVLYGGTAIALRLGHRQSADFDFFSDHPLDQQALLSALSFLHHSETLQDQRDTWVILTDREEPAGDQRVKLSFFGGIHHGRVGSPAMTRDGVVLVASLEDLIATKLKVILQRAEAKDYRDIATMRPPPSGSYRPSSCARRRSRPANASAAVCAA